MASRAIKSDPASFHQLGDQMRQGSTTPKTVPHGLAASMKQGSATPKAHGKPQEIGPRMKQGK